MPVTWNPISVTTIQPIGPTKSSTQHNNQSGQQPSLLSGQVYKAQVSGQASEGRFILDIGGRSFLAESGKSLLVGSKIDLQVVSVTPRLELQIVADPLSRDIGRSIFLLNQPPNISQTLSSLLQQSGQKSDLSTTTRLLFEQFTKLGDIVDENQGNGKLLQNIIHRLGLNLEKNLAEDKQQTAAQTLKNGLLEAGRLFQHDEALSAKINHLVQTLDLFQSLQVKFGNESQFFVPLLLPFLDQGYLLISDEDGKKQAGNAEDDAWKYSLHLKMQGLGNMRIELEQKQGKLDVNFFCEDRKRVKFLADFKDELQQRISLLDLESVRFHMGAKEPVAEILHTLRSEERGIINTKI